MFFLSLSLDSLVFHTHTKILVHFFLYVQEKKIIINFVHHLTLTATTTKGHWNIINFLYIPFLFCLFFPDHFLCRNEKEANSEYLICRSGRKRNEVGENEDKLTFVSFFFDYVQIIIIIGGREREKKKINQIVIILKKTKQKTTTESTESRTRICIGQQNKKCLPKQTCTNKHIHFAVNIQSFFLFCFVLNIHLENGTEKGENMGVNKNNLIFLLKKIFPNISHYYQWKNPMSFLSNFHDFFSRFNHHRNQ